MVYTCRVVAASLLMMPLVVSSQTTDVVEPTRAPVTINLPTKQPTSGIQNAVTSCNLVNVQPNTVEEDCASVCSSPTEFKWTDGSVGPTTTDPIVYRYVSCNCTIDTNIRCLDITQVWDTSTDYKEDCVDYNITSQETCRTFCKQINPTGFAYETTENQEIICGCGTDKNVCGSGGVMSANVFANLLVSALLAGGFLFGTIS
jgi:hypothetical protein